ncbi:transposase domain-containing protein [Bartonella taylorii]|uniref:Mu transposase C-terminal domain-containing protein n=1 Tax=Bartonella taylorii TaxID=33046 RepID=A0A9Q8YYQ5_BARTA|nr:transposase domain-containing protein [Bartonella taylorii]USP03568.1 Mu transposase C-terminal domain-containing protein [Bartonella taylorii]
MKEWFRIAELAEADLPGLPKTYKSLENHGRAYWRKNSELSRKVGGKTKPVWEYHISLLPEGARAALLVRSGVGVDVKQTQGEQKTSIWVRYEGLSKAHKRRCEERLKALCYWDDLLHAGMGVHDAASLCAVQFGVSRMSLFNWRQMVEGYERPDWLAALAPCYGEENVSQFAPCHEGAWEVFCSDYLRPSRPAFSACYRRMVSVAQERGWAPIPSERALRRRFKAQVSKAVVVLAREGEEKAKKLYPAQRRDRSSLHALQAVNMDGHKLDVFVNVPWGEKPVRLYLIAIQDLYSGKILSWRLSDAETWEIVRLVIGDMVEAYGIPERMTLDNGRAFTSKWISGGVQNRFRFKIKPDDPQGLLTSLGVQLQWTTPYSGQSKPIERAWRDLAEAISKHPFCAGAYTGNKPDAKPEDYGKRAIGFDEFKAHVGAQICAHNAQAGRKAVNCAGRSFDETFTESLQAEGTIVRQATAAQRALWLLTSEALRAQKGTGEIHFYGNRYWARALNEHAGQKVIVRFDPDNLHQDLRVYDLNNRLLCLAPCLCDVGFYDQQAARLNGRLRKEYVKAVKAEKQLAAKLAPDHLADVYGRLEKKDEALKSKAPIKPKVSRLMQNHVGNLALTADDDEVLGEEEFSHHLHKALRKLSASDEGREVIKFPKR